MEGPSVEKEKYPKLRKYLAENHSFYLEWDLLSDSTLESVFRSCLPSLKSLDQGMRELRITGREELLSWLDRNI